MDQKQPKNIFYQTEELICNILSTDSSLSTLELLPENDKDIEGEVRSALLKQGIAVIVTVDSANYAGILSSDSVWEIPEMTIYVSENPIVNRASNNAKYIGTCQDVACRCIDTLVKWRNKIQLASYQQGEEDGLLNAKVTLKTLVSGGK